MDFSIKNLSRGRIRSQNGDGRVGQIADFAFSENRERDWQNVLTCHTSSVQPFMWSYANHSISKVSVQQPQSANNVKVTSVAVSQCGNFGVLGYESGAIQKFNMQSGNDRGYFRAKDASQRHSKEVTGVAIDQLNHFLISCSLDGTIKLWEFYRQGLAKTITQEHPVENLCYNHFNDLMAISTSDLTVSILNAKNGLSKVRTFPVVSQNRITDMCFSKPDCKWLIVASLDKSIKVFDILTSTLIDWVQFQRAPLSIDFALSGEFLATSHVGEKGVYLWSNKTFFQNLVVQKVPTEPIKIELPQLSKMEQVK